MQPFADAGRPALDGRTWVSHRDSRVLLPMSEVVRHDAGGIPYQAPAITLFLKAKATRPKDDADLEVALPTLDPDERHWLAGTIELVHPGHRRLATIVDGPDGKGAGHEIVYGAPDG